MKKTMETLYRKVAVSERLPKKDGNYYTEQGFVTFEKGTFWQYEGRAFVKSNSNITHWLESIPDPTAQLQADKEELLEMLKAVTKQLHNYSQVWNYDESKLVGNSESLIQKHKK